MKTKILIASLVVGLAVGNIFAQPGGPPGRMMAGPPKGPGMGGYMAKIFGDFPGYTADMEMQVTGSSGDMTIPGKIAVSENKSRFEMDMAQVKSASITPETAARFKMMGMDKMVSIGRPDKKLSCVLMPTMKAYYEQPIEDADALKTASDYKAEKTKLGEETIDGHPCIKYKVVTTDSSGTKNEATVWTANDLKDFPIKVQTDDSGSTVSMLFKNVKIGKPDDSVFEAPSDYTKYNSFMEAMMSQMQKARPH